MEVKSVITPVELFIINKVDGWSFDKTLYKLNNLSIRMNTKNIENILDIENENNPYKVMVFSNNIDVSDMKTNDDWIKFIKDMINLAKEHFAIDKSLNITFRSNSSNYKNDNDKMTTKILNIKYFDKEIEDEINNSDNMIYFGKNNEDALESVISIAENNEDVDYMTLDIIHDQIENIVGYDYVEILSTKKIIGDDIVIGGRDFHIRKSLENVAYLISSMSEFEQPLFISFSKEAGDYLFEVSIPLVRLVYSIIYDKDDKNFDTHITIELDNIINNPDSFLVDDISDDCIYNNKDKHDLSTLALITIRPKNTDISNKHKEHVTLLITKLFDGDSYNRYNLVEDVDFEIEVDKNLN